jgi:acyl carrier protein
MTKQEIAEKIILNISNKLGISTSEVSHETSFKSAGVNSLDVVEIIVDAEKEFNINVPDNRLTMFQSVGILVDYVDTSLNGKLKKRRIN